MPNRKFPNILFILSDDQGAWAMGCYGNPEIKTPHLDRLASQGVRFEHFFCASPVCSPARASLLTGRIPSQHGVHDYLCEGNGGCGVWGRFGTVSPLVSERGRESPPWVKVPIIRPR